MSRRPRTPPQSHDDKRPWLWGTHPVLAALANPRRDVQRFVLTEEARRAHADKIEPILSKRWKINPEIIERTGLDALLPPAAVHQGMALLAAPLPSLGVEHLIRAAENQDHAVIVALDQITDPHNVGAILRSAAAFGALAVMAPERHAPSETGILAKSASGALEIMPLARISNLARAIDQLKEAGFWVAGLDGSAPQTLASAKLSGKIVLVLGAEGDGMRRLTREKCDYLVKLPQTDLIESLNVSNAAAVALYELVREKI